MSTRKPLYCSVLKTSNIMRGVTISPLAALGETHEEKTQKEETQKKETKKEEEEDIYDQKFRDEEDELCNHFGNYPLKFYDPYTNENRPTPNQVKKNKIIKRNYITVTAKALGANWDDNLPCYVIKNYSIAHENWYDYKISITFEELQSSLKKMESLPSRYSMYCFLDNFYMRTGYFRGEGDRPVKKPGNEDMLENIWRNYYDIVNIFYSRFHDMSENFDQTKLETCVDEFVELLKLYKQVHDDLKDKSPR